MIWDRMHSKISHDDEDQDDEATEEPAAHLVSPDANFWRSPKGYGLRQGVCMISALYGAGAV